MKKEHMWACLAVYLIGVSSGIVLTLHKFDDRIQTVNQMEMDVKQSKEDMGKVQKELQTTILQLQKENGDLGDLVLLLQKEAVKIDDIINNPNVSITQGVNRKQLRNIIQSTLRYLGEKKSLKEYTDLLMITAQIESDLGHYFKQIRGPAVGIFQMEPQTERSVWSIYLKRNKTLAQKIKKLQTCVRLESSHESEWNIAYAIGMAYALYKWRKVDPSEMSVDDMTRVYKVHWNTLKGKTDREKMVKKLVGSKVVG